MKLLYLSSSYFYDTDINLIHRLRKFIDVDFIVQITASSLKSTILDIKTPPPATGLYKFKDIPELSVFKDFIDENHSYFPYRASSRLYSFQTLKFQRVLEKLISDVSPDIIHFNGLCSFNMGLFLARNKIPSVQTLHDPIPHSSDICLKTKLMHAMNNRFIRNKIILNKTLVPEFIKRSKIKEDNIRSSRLGVFEYLSLIGDKKPRKRNKILFFGRIEGYKGVEFLLEAFNKISPDFPDIELVIAGSGRPYWDKSLENNAKIKVINRYIENEEIADLLRESLCVVCPYRDATQSGVVMSSYALNVPVISTRVGAMSEYVIESQTGELIPPMDSAKLAATLADYIRENKFEKYSKNIAEISSSGMFSWEKIAREYVEFYNDILSRK